jgi:hypothetical protein
MGNGRKDFNFRVLSHAKLPPIGCGIVGISTELPALQVTSSNTKEAGQLYSLLGGSLTII